MVLRIRNDVVDWRLYATSEGLVPTVVKGHEVDYDLPGKQEATPTVAPLWAGNRLVL